MSKIVCDLDNWYRDSHGRSFQFYACDEEILEVLQSALPEAFSPYSLIGSYVEKHGRKYFHRFIEDSVNGFLSMRAESIWQFFIRSHQITPEVKLPNDNDVDMYLSLNGLVNLQQGSIRKGCWQPCAIGLVNRIRNTQTNEMMIHKHYECVFATLKSTIRKKMQYSTKHVMADNSIEESKTLMMSTLFANQCISGDIQAIDRVGHPI